MATRQAEGTKILAEAGLHRGEAGALGVVAHRPRSLLSVEASSTNTR